MKHLLKTIQVLVLILLFTVGIFPLVAQELSKGLIFSEVYLDENQKENSWVEIYNPTDSRLTVTGFRHSAVKTVNLLRPEEKDKSFSINPGECLILCVNKEVFYSKWEKSIKTVEVKGMVGFGTGGFMSLRYKNTHQTGVDVFRYGNPDRSTRVAEIAGNTVLGFAQDSKSWNRKVYSKEYSIAEPTPGINK
ncbi:hypothetical protein ACFL6G_07915 [candidate division KSB1 bacterium]